MTATPANPCAPHRPDNMGQSDSPLLSLDAGPRRREDRASGQRVPDQRSAPAPLCQQVRRPRRAEESRARSGTGGGLPVNLGLQRSARSPCRDSGLRTVSGWSAVQWAARRGRPRTTRTGRVRSCPGWGQPGKRTGRRRGGTRRPWPRDGAGHEVAPFCASKIACPVIRVTQSPFSSQCRPSVRPDASARRSWSCPGRSPGAGLAVRSVQITGKLMGDVDPGVRTWKGVD